MKNFKNISGYPESINISKMQSLENLCKNFAENLGAIPVLLPVVEKRELFERSVGNSTDIVEKEMLSLSDKDLVLRPEGTAVAIRMWNNNGGLRNLKQQRWYYSDFMFRNETPQSGRFKQFKQFGIEFLGYKEGLTDIEVLCSLDQFFKELGINEKIKLKLNIIGSKEERTLYLKELTSWLTINMEKLDSLSKQRCVKNPLRIFDSKIKETQLLLKEAPLLYDYLNIESKQYFETIITLLNKFNVNFEIDYTLVRGLDYYNGLVFEFVYLNEDKSQNAVAAGGRYDSLSKSINGENVPAMGFAVGMERLYSLYSSPNEERKGFYICWLDNCEEQALRILFKYRKENIITVMDTGNRKLVKQLKQADESNFRYAIIIGESEVEGDFITRKDLETGEEIRIF